MASADGRPQTDGVWAEQSVIGSMLIDVRCVGLVMASLTEGDFLMDADRRIFLAYQARFAKNQPMDPVMICEDVAPGDGNFRGYILQLMVSLWDICHTTDPAKAKPYAAPQGSRGLYQTGECCLWEGQVLRSKVDNNPYSPSDYPANWEAVSNLDTGEEG